jgi:hypothetical protein
MRRFALIVLTLASMAVSAWSKPIIINGYYTESATGGCTKADFCNLDQFTAVPAGSQLIITRASCFITSDGAAKILQVQLTAKFTDTNTLPNNFLVPKQVNTAGGRRQYILNEEVLVPYDSRQTPLFEAVFDQASDIIGLGCSVSGNLIP